MIRHVTMDWTKGKAVQLLSLCGYKKRYLNSLSDSELFELGKEERLFKGKNPFNVQTKLGDHNRERQ